MNCDVCGSADFVTVTGDARRYFPSGRRCARFFTHGAPTVVPIALCGAEHLEYIGLTCAEVRGHDTGVISHFATLVVLDRQEHLIVW